MVSLLNTLTKGTQTKHTGYALIFLDISAAFDTVSHDILLNRLKEIGIQGIILQWFQPYLSKRYQQIRTYTTTSKPYQQIQGVPQGYALSAMLFNIYPQSLCSMIRSHNVDFHVYADDIMIYGPITTSNPSSPQL